MTVLANIGCWYIYQVSRANDPLADRKLLENLSFDFE